jgi:hypothetical protein
MECQHHFVLKSSGRPTIGKCKRCKMIREFEGGLPEGTELLRANRPWLMKDVQNMPGFAVMKSPIHIDNIAVENDPDGYIPAESDTSQVG